MKIPTHLQHLRTDRRGLPVPYINRWGPERVEALAIRHDPWVNMLGLYFDDADQTEPDFTAQNQQRQRECMIRGLCQVCAVALSWSSRYLVVADLSVDHITIRGEIYAALTEPWLCVDCAMFATRVCPALIRRRHGEHLQLVHITSRDQVQLVVSTGWVEGPLEAESRSVQPAFWVKALLPALQAVPT